MNNAEFKINKSWVGDNHPVYIIAELSANHEQNLDLAVRHIQAMKDTGADAVKLQTFSPDSMALDSDKPWFKTREDSLWAGMRLHELYEQGYTPREWHAKLQQITLDFGMDFFSSPFDPSAVDFLETLNVPAYKIASPEITDIPLIKRVAQTGKPVIFSTGIATKEDVELALKTCKDEGNTQCAVLKCTTAYPTPYGDLNLLNIPRLRNDFDVVAGLSDHSLGIEVPVTAVSLGAKIIEKHFILDRNGNGLDRAFSLEPHEFKDMVTAVRHAEDALGSDTYDLPKSAIARFKPGRSLFAIEDIKEGAAFTVENVRSLRPGIGMHPKEFEKVLSKTASMDIEKGAPLSFDMVDGLNA